MKRRRLKRQRRLPNYQGVLTRTRWARIDTSNLLAVHELRAAADAKCRRCRGKGYVTKKGYGASVCHCVNERRRA